MGIKTIAFRCGGWNDKDLAGAIMIYDGPADLLVKDGVVTLSGWVDSYAKKEAA